MQEESGEKLADLERRLQEKEDELRRQREELRRKEVERTKREIESIRIDEAKKYAQSLVDKGILKAGDVDVSVNQVKSNLLSYDPFSFSYLFSFKLDT